MTAPSVTRLPPVRPGWPWLRPRCEQEVSELVARWRIECGRGHDLLCENRARYQVDGRKLCKRHAGDAVLTALAGQP